MKFVYALAIFVVLAVGAADDTNDDDPKMQEAKEKCIARLGADDADMFVFLVDEPPETKHQACLGACYLKEYGAMEPDNQLVESELLKLDEYDEEEVGPILRQMKMDVNKHCIEQQSRDEDECVVFEEYVKCVRNKLKEKSPTKYVQDKCIEIHGGSESDRPIMVLKKKPEDKKGSCIGACFYKEIGFMKNDRVVRDKVLQLDDDMTPAEKMSLTRIVDRCLDAQKDATDECDAFKKFATCYSV